MPKDVVQIGDEVLRKVAPAVPIESITADEIQKVIHNMITTLEYEPDGVAIAAPQIGESWRIFVVSKRVFHDTIGENAKDQVYINPIITNHSKQQKWMDGEGCLSVRWQYGQAHRYTNVTLEAYDEKGQKFTRGAGGLLAHIFQHEIDHLNGILFVDHARHIHDLDPEEIKRIEQEKRDHVKKLKNHDTE